MSVSFMPSLGNIVSARVKSFFPEIVGTTVTGTGGVVAWQAQAQWLLSVTAALVSIVVGFLTIRSLLKKEKQGSK